MDSVHTTTDLDICDNTTPADAGSMDMLDVSGSGKKKRKHKKKKKQAISAYVYSILASSLFYMSRHCTIVYIYSR